MTPEELQNWLSVYAATALCCAFGALLAAMTVGIEMWRERAWNEARSIRGALLFVPRLWWRWQKRYLMGTPVILAIVAYYGATLNL